MPARYSASLCIAHLATLGLIFAGSGWGAEQGRNHNHPAAKTALLTQIRHTSSKNYTRIIIELSTEVRFKTNILKEETSRSLPPRIYVDLLGTRLAMDGKRPIPVQDGLLRQVRVSQFSPDVVRVVLDMQSLREHKAFLLPDPYRLVIDIRGERNGVGLAALDKAKGPASRPEKSPSAGLRKIVLDPGHGGKDPGALGVRGLAEKDIVLGVAQKLAKKLQKELGVQVILTRNGDSFIALEDRTAIANAQDADLFVSLHANASPNPEAKGIETFYLDNTNDEASIRLAARENGTSRKGVSDIQFILSDLIQSSKMEDSIALANHLQSSVVSHIAERYGEIKDLGVKKAPFYVLVLAKMPSALVEISFITNRKEASQLSKASYQEALVEALYQGIKKYRDAVAVAKSL